MALDRVDALRAFEASARTSGFAAAGRTLGLSRDQVSKLVAALEARLQRKLFDRSTRMLRLTPAGATYVEHIRPILEALSAAESALRADDLSPTGALKVHAPVSFGHAILMPQVAVFMRKYPGIDLALTFDDNFNERELMSSDIVVRIASSVDTELAVETLAQVKRGIYASKSYLEERGIPSSTANLVDHDCIQYANLESGTVWVLEREGLVERVQVQGRLSVGLGLAARTAIEMGLGIGVLPNFLADDGASSVSLVRVLPGWSPTLLNVFALTSPTMENAPKIKAYCKFLQKTLPTILRSKA